MTATAEATRKVEDVGDRSLIVVPGKYLSVTSYRRDGTPVATPVWFVQEDGRLFFETDGASFKVRRIRRNPAVLVAPCSASGRIRGSRVSGRAQVLGPEALERVRRLMARKYRVDKVLILPIYRAVQAIRRKGSARGHAEPVIVAVAID